MKREVLTIYIIGTGEHNIKTASGEACMVLFTGYCDCELFHGDILRGGVDTQKEFTGEARSMSARYMLEGIDCDGQQCKIFIENNSILGKRGDPITTIPTILTDSKALAFLEHADLTGLLDTWEKGVVIHIYENIKD